MRWGRLGALLLAAVFTTVDARAEATDARSAVEEAKDMSLRCEDRSDCPIGPCVNGRCVVCGRGPDCDGDGVSDLCAIRKGAPDCDGNGKPDACDLDVGGLDCDDDGQLDACVLPAEGCENRASRGFVTYAAGALPIVITVPHGGNMKPEDLADRKRPGPQDEFTIELSDEVVAALLERTGKRPHRVIVHLHRDKLDVNREIDRGAGTDPEARRAWRAFHGYVEEAKRALQAQFGRGLVLDLHGLSDRRTHHQLGVLLNAVQLGHDDEALAHPAHVLGSSVRNLASVHPSGLAGVVRGLRALGSALMDQGFDTLPSADQPEPSDTEPYFSGGYITWRHGSRHGGPIDAVQLEVRGSSRRSPEARRAFAAALADGLLELSGQLQAPTATTAGPRLALEVWPNQVSDGGRVRVTLSRTEAETDLDAGPLTVPGLRFDPPVQVRLGPEEMRASWWARARLERTGARNFELKVGEAKASLRVTDPDLDPTLRLWVGASGIDRSNAGARVHELPRTLGREARAALEEVVHFEDEGDRLVVDDIDYGGGGFTLAFFFEPQTLDVSGARYLVSHGRFGRPRSLHVFQVPRGILRTAVQGFNEGHVARILDVELDEGPHHYALVVRPGPKATVYLDGEPIAHGKRGRRVGRPRTPLHFGGRHDLARGRDFRGWMGEQVVFARALTDEEVRALAQMSLGAPPDAPEDAPPEAPVVPLAPVETTTTSSAAPTSSPPGFEFQGPPMLADPPSEAKKAQKPS